MSFVQFIPLSLGLSFFIAVALFFELQSSLELLNFFAFFCAYVLGFVREDVYFALGLLLVLASLCTTVRATSP